MIPLLLLSGRGLLLRLLTVSASAGLCLLCSPADSPPLSLLSCPDCPGFQHWEPVPSWRVPSPPLAPRAFQAHPVCSSGASVSSVGERRSHTGDPSAAGGVTTHLFAQDASISWEAGPRRSLSSGPGVLTAVGCRCLWACPWTKSGGARVCGHTLVCTLTFTSALHWCLHLQHNRFTLASLPVTCAQVRGLLLLQ